MHLFQIYTYFSFNQLSLPGRVPPLIHIIPPISTLCIWKETTGHVKPSNSINHQKIVCPTRVHHEREYSLISDEEPATRHLELHAICQSIMSRTRDYTQLNNIEVDVVEMMEQRIHHTSPSAQHLNSAETSLTSPKPETVITSNEHSCYPSVNLL